MKVKLSHASQQVVVFSLVLYLVWWRVTMKRHRISSDVVSQIYIFLKSNELNGWLLFSLRYITVHIIKWKHTTCFLLLLCLQFQKLSRFQKRFDAHFYGHRQCVRLWGEKALKSAGARRNSRLSTKMGEAPSLKLGKRVIWILPHWKLDQLRRQDGAQRGLWIVFCSWTPPASLTPQERRADDKTRSRSAGRSGSTTGRCTWSLSWKICADCELRRYVQFCRGLKIKCIL